MRRQDYIQLDEQGGGNHESLRSNWEKGEAKKEEKQSWLRTHWCILCNILLLLIGVLIPLYMYFLYPCHDKITHVKQPVDLVFMLDKSGSIEPWNWDREVDSAIKWTEAFEQDIPELQVGVITFSTVATTEHPLSEQETTAIETLESLKGIFPDGSTNYLDAMNLFEEQIQQYGQNDSFVIGVMISDGKPKVSPRVSHVSVDAYPAVCVDRANELKARDFNIVGVIVQNTDEGRTLFAVSSCDENTYDERDQCDFFFESTDWAEFNEDVKHISASIATKVGDREQVTCESSWSLLFLLLGLPLLILLCTQWCVRSKETILVRKKVINGSKGDPALRAAQMSAPEQVKLKSPPPPPGDVKKKKYKWETAPANYLWAFQGGATPLNVDFGEAVPPSAPRDHQGGRRRRSVKAWEEADGYEYEVVEENRTLELVVEDALARSWCARYCCCCCCTCCRTKSESQSTHE